MTILAILLLSTVPALREPVQESVDLVEVNHFYDEQGRLVFDQIIFYDLAPSRHVVAEGYTDTTNEYVRTTLSVPDREAVEYWQPKTELVTRYRFVQHDYHVRAWRLIKSDDQLPRKDWQNGGYVVNWRDGEVWREVRAAGYRETWTQYDVELIEREYLPKEQRIELKPANACPRGGN